MLKSPKRRILGGCIGIGIKTRLNHFYIPVTEFIPDKVIYLAYGNSKLIISTIVNLLTNAIKYIGFEGKTVPNQVHISISVIDDRVAVQVDDNGRGIPAKDIDHLFERFYRVDNSGNREVGGSGIGLAIAKEIADMHDGVISVTSTFGQGATFVFSLPTGKTVFDAAYSDAKAGIVSDKPLHRAAAYFLGLQECEAVRSLGYKDLESVVDEYEIIPEPEVAARDKALAKLLSSFGDERFEELKDELLYVEDYEEIPDSPVTGLESEIAKETTIEEIPITAVPAPMPPMSEQLSIPLEKIIPQEPYTSLEATGTVVNEPVQEQQPVTADQDTVSQQSPFVRQIIHDQEEEARKISEAEALAREEARLQAKEEARKLLTQPVVQISAEQRKTVSQINRESREKRVIHPIEVQKRYNSKNAKSGDSVKHAESEPQERNDVTVKSSLKKILDESDTRK